MKKPIEELIRIQVDADNVNLELEPLERQIHLSPMITAKVYTLVGVASSDLDVLVTEDFFTPNDERDIAVAILSKKTGKYDGSIRDRLILRRFQGHQCKEIPFGEIRVVKDNSNLDLFISNYRCGYRVWTHELTDPQKAGNIVRWHWRRYYSFLSEKDIMTYAEGFSHRVVGLNLASANRLASRELYALARAAGYRKLTLRQQQSLKLEGQWHKDAVILAAHNKNNGTGCGEYTLLSSSMASHIETWLDS
jgi:hypothetical protein